MGPVDQMHRTALAGCATGNLAVKLGHQGVHVSAVGEIDSVPAIGSRDDIVWSQNVANADGDCLLANGEMHGAFDLIARIYASDFFLNVPDVSQATINSSELVGR